MNETDIEMAPARVPEETPIKPAAAISDTKQKTSIKDAFLSFIWDNDTHLKSPEERRLLFKLDCAMLSCLCLGFFCKYLDQNNITNAYNSGMKEDLGWHGNQYTYAQSLYTAAYAIMQVPSTLIVQRVRPSYWLAGCELAWAAFTFAQAAVHNTNTMYALRFMVGFFESAFFPTGLYLLGSWYTPHELAKRTAIFHMTAALGAMVAGYLQAAVFATLNGTHGIEGWRWLYIICGIITAPCAILILLVLPEYPSSNSGKRWYLSDEEFELAQARMQAVKRVQTTGLMNVAVLKRIFSKWHVYLLPLTYIFYGMSCQSLDFFGIWLKSTKKYDVVLINIFPTITKAVQVFFTLLWGFLSDYTGSRFLFCVIPMTYGSITNGILAGWPSSLDAKMFAFSTGSITYCTAVMYSWWSEICTGDPLERALVIGLSNGLQYATNAWLPILIFPQVEAPSFRKGFPTTFSFAIITIILLCLVWWLQKRELRRQAADRENMTQDDVVDIKDDKEPIEPDTASAAPVLSRRE